MGEFLRHTQLLKKFIAGNELPVLGGVFSEFNQTSDRFMNDAHLIDFIFNNAITLRNTQELSKNVFLYKFMILCHYVKIDQVNNQEIFEQEAAYMVKDLFSDFGILYEYELLKKIIRETDNRLINDSGQQEIERTFFIINENYEQEKTTEFYKTSCPQLQPKEPTEQKNAPSIEGAKKRKFNLHSTLFNVQMLRYLFNNQTAQVK